MLKKFMLGAGALALTVAAAEAKTFKEWVTPDNKKCYVVEYIQATYLVNTRGKLVKPERYVWEGEIADGNKIYHRRVPATYLQTRKLLEKDHYTLKPC